MDLQRRAKCPGNESAVMDRRQVHQPGAIGIAVCMLGNHLVGQACLADTGRAGKGHQAALGQETCSLSQLVRATDKPRRVDREVIPAPIRRISS